VAEPIPDPNLIFKFQKAYLKDTSYESPNAPRLLAEPKSHQISARFNVTHQAMDDEQRFYEVVLHVRIESMHDDEVAFVVELQQAGVFEIAGVAPEELPILLEVRCPEILLGFARQAVCDLVVKGGFPQLLINPVNFHALYSQKLGSNKRQVQD
jgi:preprotein translocase subunit SecB